MVKLLFMLLCLTISAISAHIRQSHLLSSEVSKQTAEAVKAKLYF